MLKEQRKIKLETAHIPNWFKALIHTASKGGRGTEGYQEAGYHVGIHLDDLIFTYHNEGKEEEIVKEFNEGDIRECCAKWIPHIMRHVPYERRDVFFKGLEECLQERGLSF